MDETKRKQFPFDKYPSLEQAKDWAKIHSALYRASCGYGKTQYYHIWALLWDFFAPKIRYFQQLNN